MIDLKIKIDLIFEHFPELQEKYDAIRKERADREAERQDKFMREIMEETGLDKVNIFTGEVFK